MDKLAAFMRWLGSPFRAMARALMTLISLSPRQMQSVCTLSMIGGIIANSFWTFLYITGVRRAVDEGMDYASPYFDVATSTVQYLAIMSGCFALFMCLIAFGADWLRIKYKDFEAGAGNGPE